MLKAAEMGFQTLLQNESFQQQTRLEDAQQVLLCLKEVELVGSLSLI